MSQTCFRFGDFELDTESSELRRSGNHVNLERIPMQLLILLLENPGKLVRREAIIERLWGGNVFVEAEHSINTAVNKLRAILRDDSRNPRYIRTVVGQGYCFIAEVTSPQPVQTVPSAILGEPANGHEDRVRSLPSIEGNGHSSSSPMKEEPATDTGRRIEQYEEPHRETPDTPDATIARPFRKKTWFIAGATFVVAVLLIAVVAIYVLRRQKEPRERVEEGSGLHSLAVLPFRNLAQTSDEDYLVDGMTDELTTQLAKSTSLRVISQRSAMQYKGVQKPLGEIAKALNVDAIVEGSYLRADKRVRITAQLLDARNDRHLWAQTYDDSGKDLLFMQDQVTNDIAQQVAIVLGSGFTRSKLSMANPRAREAYLRGRYFWNERTLAALTNSVKYYTEAIREDPNYADAYAALAEAYVLLAIYGDPNPSDILWKAQYAAERALELDSGLGEAHAALGAVKVERDWDWEGATKEYQRALQLNPADATAHHWYSLHLSRMGKPQEAEMEIELAVALDPLSLMINTDAAETAYWARNPQKAMSRIESVLVLNPEFAEAHLAKGKVLEQMHRYPEAIAEFETAKKFFGGALYADAFRAHALALAGEKDDALKVVKQLESVWPSTHLTGADIAIGYCGLGQPNEAMKWLNLAYQRHEQGLGMIAIDPVFDGCRSDPRFKELLSRLKLVS
jgi:TolB-like protein/DNA-binding winged helix-turn-helix (wHTH) protein/Tfp pilus assembly protein PilF